MSGAVTLAGVAAAGYFSWHDLAAWERGYFVSAFVLSAGLWLWNLLCPDSKEGGERCS